MTLILALLLLANSQDSREALGPQDRPGAKTPNPLMQMMKDAHPQLRKELVGMHPRVFVTATELAALKVRAHGSHAALWKRALPGIEQYVTTPPSPAPAQERRGQNNTGLGIAALAFGYRIERRPEFLSAARKYMDAALTYDIWGYANNKPNVDLAAGHLLYGLAIGYDLLYDELTPADRARYRDALQRHGKLLAEYFRPKPGRTIAYSQNHTFIPIAGLAVAAYVLYDEIPEAPEWAAESRAIFDRVLATYSKDGYYYEGFEYWVFATPWIVHYLDAHLHATGENLYDQPGLRNAHLYVANSVLPDGKNIFDFGDAFDGANTRDRTSPEAERTHPGGHLVSNYNLLYRFASQFQSKEAQGVAQSLDKLGQVNAEDFWSLVWYDASVATAPIPPSHYFPDHDVLYWRTDWSANATALAIKCGPPEGHAATVLAAKFPDWHQETGHAHPDAGSFIWFAHGKYITGDSGYAGLPKTDQHNTLLIDGQGQEMPGATHNAFAGAANEILDKIHLTPGSGTAVADFGAAYPAALGVESAKRTFQFDANTLTITDEVRTARLANVAALFHFDSKPALFTVVTPAHEVTEANVITSAGPPGAVDKGPREQRGWRLAESLPAPSRTTTLTLKLKLK